MTRYAQILARIITYILIAIAAKFGADLTDAEAGPVADAIAVAVVAAVGLIIDIKMHRSQQTPAPTNTLKPPKLPSYLLLLPLLLLIGCATAAEDRGTVGDSRHMIVINKNVGESGSVVTQDIDEQKIKPALQAIDDEIAKLKAGLAKAKAAKEPNQQAIAGFESRIAAAEAAREGAAGTAGKIKGGVVYIDASHTDIHISGKQDADSSGQTGQSPANTPQFEIPISIVPKPTP